MIIIIIIIINIIAVKAPVPRRQMEGCTDGDDGGGAFSDISDSDEQLA